MKEVKMDIKFFIPSDQVVPTKLRLLVDGRHVYYYGLHDDFGYDFEIYNATPEEAIQIATEIARKMCWQSYDHGAEWRIRSIELLPYKYDEQISYTVRVLFRWKDSY